MRQLNAAAKSKNGKAVRRAVDMMVRSTALAPSYNVLSQAVKPKRKGNRNKTPGKSSISMCVGKMLYAGLDTFSQMAQGACIPDGSSVSSVRSSIRQQLYIGVGTQGIGFCHFFVPLASDALAAVSTLVTFTGTDCRWLTANNTINPVGIATTSLALPATASQLLTGNFQLDDRPGFSGRVVAAGYTFRYTGKEIDRGGQVYSYTHPQHQSSGSMFDSSGGEVIFNGPNLAQFLETHIVETAREETTIPLFPTSERETDYSNMDATSQVNVVYPWSAGADRQPNGFTYLTGSNNCNCGIPVSTLIIVGTPGTQYTINYGQHMEYIGQGVRGFSKLPAESDPVGVQDLMSAYSRFSVNRQREAGVNPLPEFKRALKEIQSSRNIRMTI